MKKLLTRVFSLCLVFVLLIGSIPAASAYTVASASLTSDPTGGNKTVFFVDTNDKNTAKIKYKCDPGMFAREDGKATAKFGYFEIRIWGRNSTSENWKELTKYKVNIKNDADGTVKMKGYTQYKVQIYAWKATTAGKSMGGKYNWTGACWTVTCPSIKFTAYSSNIRRLTRI